MRPANIITAIADILAGFTVSGAALQLQFSLEPTTHQSLLTSLLWLCLSTVGLYGGGVVFNDVFDAELDKKERPERPIPSGKATVKSAGWLAAVLLMIGIASAFMVSVISGVIAFIIAVLAVVYDAWGKHQKIFGPVNMGLCRGGNLLLGVSVLPSLIGEVWFIAFFPVIYIAAITMISRGEVHGENRNALKGALFIYGFVIISLVWLSFTNSGSWWFVLPFVVLFAMLIFPPLIKALHKEKPHLIGKAVKAGVLSLIVLNASLAAAFGGWQLAALILLLLPLSLWLARSFAVT